MAVHDICIGGAVTNIKNENSKVKSSQQMSNTLVTVNRQDIKIQSLVRVKGRV